MSLVTLLAILQAAAGIFLACLPFSQRLYTGTGLTRPGKGLVALSALVLISSIAWSQILNDEAARRNQERIEGLLDTLFSQLVGCVMRTPSGPDRPSTSPVSDAVQIIAPADSSRVASRELISGKVSDPSSSVWVMVHPLGTSSYWVQPRVSVRSGGEWSVEAYFGRSAPIDSEKSFEVLAIVDPLEPLSEGMIFDRWPPAAFSSRAVVLVRE